MTRPREAKTDRHSRGLSGGLSRGISFRGLGWGGAARPRRSRIFRIGPVEVSRQRPVSELQRLTRRSTLLMIKLGAESAPRQLNAILNWF
jgi:hypothetical protein